MKLVEYRGKDVLRPFWAHFPKSLVVSRSDIRTADVFMFLKKHSQVVVKGQIPEGKRKEKGLIHLCSSAQEVNSAMSKIFKKEFCGQPITSILIEENISAVAEYYVAIVYDTSSRSPLLLVGQEGGSAVEKHQNSIVQCKLDILKEYTERDFLNMIQKLPCSPYQAEQLSVVLFSLYRCFLERDCKTLEVNPLFWSTHQKWIVGDAKIEIDDCAYQRQRWIEALPKEDDVSYLTPRECLAREIDALDYRGVAGKTFVDMDGTIAVLASGGGGSLTAMDALIKAGGKPANYTEYSGNPSREKVRRLTEITLDKPDLQGCFIVGGTANFTDIFETLSGVVEVLKEKHPTYPIVIRRGGPRYKEAFEAIRSIARDHHLDVTLLGPEVSLSEAACIMMEKVNAYRRPNDNSC